jgi:hypothetical protein
MIQPIRVDHTEFFQVTITTLQFNLLFLAQPARLMYQSVSVGAYERELSPSQRSWFTHARRCIGPRLVVGEGKRNGFFFTSFFFEKASLCPRVSYIRILKEILRTGVLLPFPPQKLI